MKERPYKTLYLEALRKSWIRKILDEPPSVGANATCLRYTVSLRKS
jgi:hypothetical protein